jgi:hypothetical protein
VISSKLIVEEPGIILLPSVINFKERIFGV